MGGRVGRKQRPTGLGKAARGSTVRLPVEAWDVAERAATALGISRDRYLEELLLREPKRMDEHGRPRWWPRSRQRELPLTG